MSLTPIWLFVAASFAISALIAFSPRLTAARLALLSPLRLLGSGQGPRRAPPTLVLAGAVFVVVAGIGAVASYVGAPSKATASGSPTHDEALIRLTDYAGSIGNEKPATADGKLLPDVNTMVERLVARLKTSPGDAKGWRMLGWSYLHTGRFTDAAAALEKALELDPSSNELKAAYEDAKTKAAQAAALLAPGPGKGHDGAAPAKKAAATEPHEHGGAIQAMVDGLAARLETSPRDVEGWTRLMRSRVVLGEKEVAMKAYLKALEVFKDDATASGTITAAATELGLKADLKTE